MALFLSTYKNKIDKKGRVSVPSQFRSTLKGEDFEGVIIYKSIINNCLEGCPLSRIVKLNEAIESMDTLSEERDAFATSILGACHQISFDTEGRIIVPKDLLFNVDIEENAVFVGKGATFEIWSSDLFSKHLLKSQEIASKKKCTFRLSANSSGS
ncbi:MAG: cell division/cell wall cluster transcriptional repressor MraZ [Alphaproteobacteria bacterium]|nr:cell division/cell wall cluster transcriptional repressor MraZ [Rickettsiales bacterium]